MTLIEYPHDSELHITDIDTVREQSNDVDSIITVCQDCVHDNIHADVDYWCYNLADGKVDRWGGDDSYQLFDTATNRLYDELQRNRSVLIHCHHGKSRSVTVAAAALARLLDIDVYDALQTIHDDRYVGPPKKSMIEKVEKYSAIYS